jgi:hypothetical protein
MSSISTAGSSGSKYPNFIYVKMITASYKFVVCFLLGESPRRKRTTFKMWRKCEIKNYSTLWGENCKTHLTIRKTLDEQMLVNHPEESIQHSKHDESLKLRIIHLCGEKTATHIRLFEKLRINRCQ